MKSCLSGQGVGPWKSSAAGAVRIAVRRFKFHLKKRRGKLVIKPGFFVPHERQTTQWKGLSNLVTKMVLLQLKKGRKTRIVAKKKSYLLILTAGLGLSSWRRRRRRRRRRRVCLPHWHAW